MLCALALKVLSNHLSRVNYWGRILISHSIYVMINWSVGNFYINLQGQHILRKEEGHEWYQSMLQTFFYSVPFRRSLKFQHLIFSSTQGKGQVLINLNVI